MIWCKTKSYNGSSLNQYNALFTFMPTFIYNVKAFTVET